MIETWGSVGYLGVFAAAFLAATVLPFSSEAIVLLMLARGYEPMGILVAATAGNVLGSWTNYLLGSAAKNLVGRFAGQDVPAKVRRWIGPLRKYGGSLLLFSWVPVIGDPLTFAAGYLSIPTITFLFFVTVGKLARYIALIWIYKA